MIIMVAGMSSARKYTNEFALCSHISLSLIHICYKGKNYQFTLNGQTGKIIGKLPVSGGKAAAWFGTILAVVFVAASLIGGLL